MIPKSKLFLSSTTRSFRRFLYNRFETHKKWFSHKCIFFTSVQASIVIIFLFFQEKGSGSEVRICVMFQRSMKEQMAGQGLKKKKKIELDISSVDPSKAEYKGRCFICP